MKTVRVITTNKILFEEISKKINTKEYLILPTIVKTGKSLSDLKKELIYIVNEVLGTDTGNIDTQAVIIDSEFNYNKGAYFIDDPLFDDVPDNANSLTAMLIGGSISVIVSCQSGDFIKGWKLGKRKVLLMESINNINELLKKALENVPFNRTTLEVENEFAKIYDKEELSGAATVSAILWENEFSISHILDFVKSSANKVKILDLGCGTGRFEEILLKNQDISPKIEIIYAVDFAPQYLVEAKNRLSQLLSPASMKKIKFLRRTAEILQWSENYFDIVIASFGVICFSKSHLTLQEVYKVLKPKGLVILNGYNRDAATYDFDKKMKTETGGSASHFAIKIDREENIMHLGTYQIQCFTFDSQGLETLLRQIGYKPKKDSIKTFPTLYGASRKDYLEQLASLLNKNKNKKSNKSVASYQRENLILDKYGSGFNEILQLIDRDLALVMPNRGFYFCMAANK